MTEHRGSGFLRRWSRRKQQDGVGEAKLAEERVEAEDFPLAARATVTDEREVDAGAVEPRAPVSLSDEDMPAIETLGPDSDFSQFLSEGVSDALRRRALRKLFALPEFGVLDGLNDYDDDFTQFAPLGDTVTYQMKQWLKQEAEAALEGKSRDGVSDGSAADVSPASESDPDREPGNDDADELGEADG
ncbi:DUF3306 domain-containing protein [Motiliproteus sediminis]|uniref:DUF3306 domain-containing protein n=1 Tax=Motiliproteus sediminis TaxID=1468178 RepID=UPI001AEFF092|nr:DUF3306 domain-containing protein [Motiliproteus sediminis]